MRKFQGLESILITGSNGFVGKSIVDYLGKLDKSLLPKEIILVTRYGLNYKVPERLSPLIRIIEHNLLMDWEFKDKPSHIINLAADGSRTAYSKESNDSYVRLNRNFANWISRQENPISVFHASSGACFGYKPLTPLSQSSDTKEAFVQARIKVEDLLLEISSTRQFPLSIGRMFSFTGVNLLSKDQYAVTAFIKSALSENRIDVQGDPLTIRSYLHQDSMSEWILKAAIAHEPDPYFQIGSNDAVTINKLAEYIAEETGAKISYSKAPSNGDIYIPDNTGTRNKLGVEEGKGWEEAVLEMITEARLLNNGTQ
jgi:nucleoside-diphosphate-sugar epimerase